MSVFSDLFLGCIAWAAAWHFAVYAIDSAISRPTWAYITKLTTGVVTAYPFVEAFVLRAAKLDGADEAQLNRLRVWVFMGYFGAYLAYGIGKVLGMALNRGNH